MTSPRADARFANAVVLITGSGRGIGRGIALQFAGEGARVVVLDRDRESCEAVAKEITDRGGVALPLIADLGEPASRARIIHDVLDWSEGRLDVLVNNAAVHGPRLPLADLSEADMRAVMEVNLIAPLLLCQDALPALSAARGSIVFVSSIQFWMPLATFAPYVATKGGLEGLTRALAIELAPSGIRVNAVAPGAIESPSMREQWAAATGKGSVPPAPTLVGRWGTDGDIAEVVCFLSSPAAAFVSGEVIRTDGGRLLSRDADPLNPKR